MASQSLFPCWQCRLTHPGCQDPGMCLFPLVLDSLVVECSACWCVAKLVCGCSRSCLGLWDWCWVALLSTCVSHSLSPWFCPYIPHSSNSLLGCSVKLALVYIRNRHKQMRFRSARTSSACCECYVHHRKSFPAWRYPPSVTCQSGSWSVMAMTLPVWGAGKWDCRIWPFSHSSKPLSVGPSGIPNSCQ